LDVTGQADDIWGKETIKVYFEVANEKERRGATFRVEFSTVSFVKVQGHAYGGGVLLCEATGCGRFSRFGIQPGEYSAGNLHNNLQDAKNNKYTHKTYYQR
jgi:hypothetical protein